MAARDIMPFASPSGGHCRVVAGPVTASQTFNEGEPLAWTTGRLVVAVDEPGAATAAGEAAFAGIAAERALNRDGSAALADQMRSYYLPSEGGEFITANYSTDGAGTAAAFTGALRGTVAGLVVDGTGKWFVDSNAATNKVLVVTRVLNSGANNRDEVFGATAGTYIVFRFMNTRTGTA